MTALWFLMMAIWVLGGLGLLWKLAAVVFDVLREPLPASLSTGPRPPVRPAVDGATDEGAELFARGRAAALGPRPAHTHHVAQRSPVAAPVAEPRDPSTPDAAGTRGRYEPSWGDLLAETLREVDAVRN